MPVTALQIKDALYVLFRVSGLPGAVLYSGIDHTFANVASLLGTLVKVAIGRCMTEMASALMDTAPLVAEEEYVVLATAGANVDALLATGDNMAAVIGAARTTVATLHALDDVDGSKAIGCLQTLDLLLLFALKLVTGGLRADSPYAHLYCSPVPQGHAIHVLTAFWLTSLRSVTMECLEPQAGPLNMGVDSDLVIQALVRLGVAKVRSETYGMVYRPPVPQAIAMLDDLGAFSRNVGKRGITASLDDEAILCGPVQNKQSGGKVEVQDPGSVLNLRTAFQFPIVVSHNRLLPVALYHTRYTSTAEIEMEYGELTKAAAEVHARCRSVVAVAGAMLPGHPEFGPPLLLGDFNIPHDYLEDIADDRSDDRKLVRGQFRADMLALGYRRHESGPLQYPRTTLKTVPNIAAGAAMQNETYDGVYQPFAFGWGSVVVRSGIPTIPALVNRDVQQLSVAGTLDGWAQNVADDAFIDGEDDDVAADGDLDDDASEQSQDAKKSGGMTIQQAFADYLRWSYNRLFGEFVHDKRAKNQKKAAKGERTTPVILLEDFYNRAVRAAVSRS